MSKKENPNQVIGRHIFSFRDSRLHSESMSGGGFEVFSPKEFKEKLEEHDIDEKELNDKFVEKCKENGYL